MIMQTINMYDQLDIEISKTPGIKITTNLPFIPVNESNLVYKAAKLLMDEFQVEQGITVDLQKFIPVAAGMAGGSSDAAATMIGVNSLLDSNSCKRADGKRREKSVQTCHIVFLEELRWQRELETSFQCPSCVSGLLIGKPAISVSTKFVYENLHANELRYHPEIDKMLDAIQWHNLNKIADCMGNVLETVTIPHYPVIQKIKDHMKEHGALNAMMSGSGPTVFGLFDKSTAEERLRSTAESVWQEPFF